MKTIALENGSTIAWCNPLSSGDDSLRSATVSPELTFIPRKAPYEILDKAAGDRLVKRLNRHPALRQLMVLAKLDPFHNCYAREGTKGKSWCVEIIPYTYWRNHWFYDSEAPDEKEHGKWWIREIDTLFTALRNDFDLVPSVSRRSGTKLIDYPTGGCHMQYGADLFDSGTLFYSRMESFHKNLYMDFANRPYIRWLFAQWSDDLNHDTLVDEGMTESFTSHAVWTEEKVMDWVYGSSFNTSSIHARFMRNGKSSYGTFEMRFLNMVENATELAAYVRFLDKWINHIREITIRGETIPFTLDLQQWDRFERLRTAKPIAKGWIESLGLQWSDYEVFWARNYRNRVLAHKIA